MTSICEHLLNIDTTRTHDVVPFIQEKYDLGNTTSDASRDSASSKIR
jgi:hypothetical protein